MADPITVRPPPVPGVPTAHLPPRAKSTSSDDIAGVAAAELGEKLLLVQAELERMRERLEQQPVKVEEEPQPKSLAGFTLQIRDWDKAIKFGSIVLALAGLLLGLKNSAEKAPEPKVDKVQQTVQDIALRVDGKSDQKGASSNGESISERVTKLEQQVRPLVAARCPRDQWLEQVLNRMGAHGIKVQDCPDSKTQIDFMAAEGLPSRTRPLPHDFLVGTPLPAPGKGDQ